VLEEDVREKLFLEQARTQKVKMESSIFLLNGIVSLIIALLLGVNFFKHYKNKKVHEIVNYLSFIGVLYLFVALFSFFWFFEALKYNPEDFLFLYSLVILIQSIFFFMIVYLMSQNKKLFYFLFFYLIIFLSFFSSAFNFLYLFLITSFLLTLLFFINLCFRKDVYSKIGYMGIFYSSFSLLLYLLLLFRMGEVFIFSFFSNLLFLILAFIFLRDIKNYPKIKSKIKRKRKGVLVFLRFFVFILILTNFVFIATIAIHEFGHLTTARFYECSYSRIVYDQDIHTEFLCNELPNKNIVVLGGVLLPLVIAGFLFILGGKLIKDISLLMIGFNLIAANKDLLDIGLSENIVTLSLTAGVLFLIGGISLLVKSRVEGGLIL
jgi:hypothetical protein